MGRNLFEIAALIDEVWDELLQFTGNFVGKDNLQNANVEILDSAGEPIDFRDIAVQLRAAHAHMNK